MTEIERYAYRAHDEFYRQVERRFQVSSGRRTFWSHKYRKAFMSIGEICIEHKFDLVDYINASFNLVQKSSTYITPKDFTGGKAVERYKTFRDEFKSEVDSTWRAMIMRLSEFEVRLIPSIYPHTEALLMDPALPFTACFRVLYSEKFSPWLCKIYGVQAREELEADSRLCEFARKHTAVNLQALEQECGRLITT